MQELDQRLKAHKKAKYLPLLDAARSWRSARKVRKHLGADALADEAIRLSVPPTMTPEEGERVIWERHRQWYESPALGEDTPSFSSGEHEDLSRSIDVVSAYLRNVVPPHALAETRESLEREVREGSFPATDLGHQPEMEPKETETDRPVESTTRVLALDKDGRGIMCIDLAGVKVWESEWNYPNKLHGYRVNLFLTRCKRWVKGYQTNAFGYEVPPHLKERGLKFEVLHLEEAAAWFTKNCIPHPPELLDAFRHPDQEKGLDAGAIKPFQGEPRQEQSERGEVGPAPSEKASFRDASIEERNRRVREYLAKHSRASASKIAKILETSPASVKRVPAWKERPARMPRHDAWKADQDSTPEFSNARRQTRKRR